MLNFVNALYNLHISSCVRYMVCIHFAFIQSLLFLLFLAVISFMVQKYFSMMYSNFLILIFVFFTNESITKIPLKAVSWRILTISSSIYFMDLYCCVCALFLDTVIYKDIDNFNIFQAYSF